MDCRFHILGFVLLILLFCQSNTAQTKKQDFRQLLKEVETQEQILAKCQPRRTRISHFCYETCPTNLVKPRYPVEAKRIRLEGSVKVDVIVNEEGKVIYASVLDGTPYLSQAARQGAYRSTFYPARDCENKTIKFRGSIIYHFY
jgi:TonB family protein